MRAVRNSVTAINRKLLGQDGRGDFVETRPTILLGNSTAQQSQLPGLFQQFWHESGLLVLEFFYQRQNFLDDKLLRCLADQFLVIR